MSEFVGIAEHWHYTVIIAAAGSLIYLYMYVCVCEHFSALHSVCGASGSAFAPHHAHQYPVN